MRLVTIKRANINEKPMQFFNSFEILKIVVLKFCNKELFRS